MALAQDAGERLAGVEDEGEVGLAMARRAASAGRSTTASQAPSVRCSAEVATQRSPTAARRSRPTSSIGSAGRDGLDLTRGRRRCRPPRARLGERDRERQPDVAEADDPDLHRREFRRRQAGRSTLRYVCRLLAFALASIGISSFAATRAAASAASESSASTTRSGASGDSESSNERRRPANSRSTRWAPDCLDYQFPTIRFTIRTER